MRTGEFVCTRHGHPLWMGSGCCLVPIRHERHVAGDMQGRTVRLLRQANMTLSVHFRKIFGVFLCYDGPLRSLRRVWAEPAERGHARDGPGPAVLQGGEGGYSDVLHLWRLCA